MQPCSACPAPVTRRARWLVPVLVGASLLAASGAAEARGTGRGFDPPVRLTPVDGFGGFEPTLTVDRSHNVWVTAHETYSPASPTSDEPAPARGASWLWVSADGKEFTSPPGVTPAGEYRQFAGSEGDLAVDGKGDVYFVDLGAVGTALTRWRVEGRGRVTPTATTPQLPVLPAADRPFVDAAGDGQLLLTQKSDSVRLFVSRDGGRSFDDPAGHVVDGASFCRPLIDRRNTARMLALCTVDTAADTLTGTPASQQLLAVTSDDSGGSWSRAVIWADEGVGQGANIVMPSVAQAPDGSIYFLHHRFRGNAAPALEQAQGAVIPTSVQLVLLRSRDGGRTWTTRDVTPAPGIWEDSSIAAAPDGRLAVSGFHRRSVTDAWSFRAATFRPGHRPTAATRVGPEVAYPASETNVPGELTQAAFGRDGKLRVVFSVRELRSAQPVNDAGGKYAVSSSVFYAQER